MRRLATAVARGRRAWAVWPLILVCAALAMLAVRTHLDKAHVALIFLLVVLGGSAAAGRVLGVALAIAAFVGFNFLFIPPYHALTIANPVDWLVLAAFLVTGVVAAQLLYRAQSATDRAAALQEADRFKDALLVGVSHDIRTPLTTIRALAHDIAAAGDERALVIEEEVRRLDRFVADLLDLSRLSAGEMPLSTAINAAEDLVGAALQRIAGMTQEREIRASLATDEPLLVGRFDFAHSLRILVNLLENALKYSPPSAPIELRVTRAGDALRFTVADRGRGIAAGEEERIFDRFYRQPGVAADVRGSGLGLAIAQGLARVQGGSLEYAPRDGGGSVFTLCLPTADLADLDTTNGDGAPETFPSGL